MGGQAGAGKMLKIGMAVSLALRIRDSMGGWRDEIVAFGVRLRSTLDSGFWMLHAGGWDGGRGLV